MMEPYKRVLSENDRSLIDAALCAYADECGQFAETDAKLHTEWLRTKRRAFDMAADLSAADAVVFEIKRTEDDER